MINNGKAKDHCFHVAKYYGFQQEIIRSKLRNLPNSPEYHRIADTNEINIVREHKYRIAAIYGV